MQYEPGEINIICTDVQASLHFYCELLGFTSTTDEEGFYHLRCGGHQYLLLPIAQPIADLPVYGSVPQFSMDLLVADIQAAYKQLKHNGVTFAKNWQEGDIMFVARDPDGLPWEIIQKGL